LICYHSINNIPCPHSALKSASEITTVQQQQQPKQLLFNESELNLVSKTLEACKFYITKNQPQYQNSKDIVNEISTSMNIINIRQNNNKSNLKGASSAVISCNEKKIQSLQNILKQFNLIH
jgi:hypothetical protein